MKRQKFEEELSSPFHVQFPYKWQNKRIIIDHGFFYRIVPTPSRPYFSSAGGVIDPNICMVSKDVSVDRFDQGDDDMILSELRRREWNSCPTG